MDKSKSKSNDLSLDIPNLLDRSEKIQLGKEWDFVQNYYSDQKIALGKNDKDQQARLNLAQLFIKEARVTGEHGHYYPGALKLLDEILVDETISEDLRFQTLTNKAGVQLSLHEFKTALATAQKALKINANNAQINGVMVDCLVEMGRYDEAVKFADKMIFIKPDLRSYARISYLREIHGDVEGAKKALELAIKSGYPGYEETAWAMQVLGEHYKMYGELDKAKKVFEQILSVREDYPFAIASIGDIYLEKGELLLAELKLKEAFDIIPEVGFAISLAEVHKLKKDQEAFDARWNEILIMLQEDVDAGHNMNLEYADLYMNLKEDYDEALKFALIEYEKRPKNIDVNRLVSQIYLLKGDTSLAKNHLESAKITKSKHPDLLEIQKVLG